MESKIINNDIIRRKIESYIRGKSVCIVGPAPYLEKHTRGSIIDKYDIIVRLNKGINMEKQPEIFKDLQKSLPQYEFVMCQEQQLSKDEYHNLLGEAKIVFSANLQETLGISWYEGALVDAIPMVPDRLSYSEMALPEFKYDSKWTEDFDSYLHNRDKVVAQIVNYMENYEDLLVSLDKQRTKLNKEFFSGKELYKAIQDE